MQNLHERVAVVTGAASGIGRGIARVLASEGASVVIADLNADAAEATAAALRGEGRDATAIAVDLVDRAAVEAMAADTLARYGRIDILAANAGIYPQVLLDDLTDTVWDQIMDVNVKGTLHAIQACLPAMRERRYGRIVLTSSITGALVASPGVAAYAASKSAMLGLMRTAALEVAGDGITVNAIMPGNVNTPGLAELGDDVIQRVVNAIPLGRLAEPEELGWAVRYLASEEAGYVTGQTLIVDGGQVLPEMLS